MKNFFKSNWALLVIMALAVFFRFWQIGHLPGGLFPDEAANGLDVNSILKGDLQPFFERGNGREALFFYFLSLSVALFGRGPWQHHIVSAGFGLVSVLAVYFLAQKMFGKRAALFAAFFMAVSSYATTVTRTAFRANAVPLFSALTLLFLVKFFQTKDNKSKYWSAILAGAFFALGFYTYTSFRMMLPLLFGFGVLLYLGSKESFLKLWDKYAKFKAAFAASFILFISWIAIYFIKHPQSFVGRSGQVSIFNKDLNNGDVVGTFIQVFKQTILAIFTNGDLNWRHNVSGYPFLSPFLSPFFAAALIIFSAAGFVLLKQIWNKKLKVLTVYQALTACWFWFMLVPEISTAEGIPHGLRLTGMIPPMFIMTGYGVNLIYDRLPNFNYAKHFKLYMAGIFLAGVFTYNFYLYFGVAANSPDYYYAFRSDLTEVSNYLNQRNRKSSTYLSLDRFSVQTTDYLTSLTNQPYILLDPARTYEVNLRPGDQVIFTQSTLFDRIKFLQTHPRTKLVMLKKNNFGQIIMLVYEQR